jgi:hypothetical protein
LTLIIIAGFSQIARWNNAQIAGFFRLKSCAKCLLTKTGLAWYNGNSARVVSARADKKAQGLMNPLDSFDHLLAHIGPGPQGNLMPCPVKLHRLAVSENDFASLHAHVILFVFHFCISFISSL